MAVRIVTDSACDLTVTETADLGIIVVPLSIRIDDVEYQDRTELTVEDFYAKMDATEKLPETAAPSPGAFEAAFSTARDEGADAVVCINLSAQLSATMQSAQNGARALEGFDVRVVDSKSITGGLGIIVTMAAEAARDGASADDIVALVESLYGRVVVLGALDTLDNLKKGGRIGGAAGWIGSMLNIKPVIDISTGVVEKASQQRTRRKSMLWLRDTLVAAGPVEHLNVLHGGAPHFDEFVDIISEVVPPDQFRSGWIGPVIGTHGGPRMVGLCYLKGA
jgi:DegV family protein with EDD domain